MIKKKAITGMLIISLIYMLMLFESGMIEAKSIDVTQKYMNKVTKLLSPFQTFLGDGCLPYMENKFDDYYKTGMVARFKGMHNALISGINVIKAKKMLKPDVELYFGTNNVKFAKYKGGNLTSPAYSFQILGDKLISRFGQWGDVYPVGIVEKISKNINGTYIVSYFIRFYIGNEGTYGNDMGRYRIKLKKANNRNGFIIKDIKRTQTYLDNSY